MNVRYKKRPDITGQASKFNTHGLGEVIVGFDGGDMTSEEISELEVLLVGGEWKGMSDAFRDHDLIVDNHNTRFFEPADDEERARGWA